MKATSPRENHIAGIGVRTRPTHIRDYTIGFKAIEKALVPPRGLPDDWIAQLAIPMRGKAGPVVLCQPAPRPGNARRGGRISCLAGSVIGPRLFDVGNWALQPMGNKEMMHTIIRRLQKLESQRPEGRRNFPPFTSAEIERIAIRLQAGESLHADEFERLRLSTPIVQRNLIIHADSRKIYVKRIVWSDYKVVSDLSCHHVTEAQKGADVVATQT